MIDDPVAVADRDIVGVQRGLPGAGVEHLDLAAVGRDADLDIAIDGQVAAEGAHGAVGGHVERGDLGLRPVVDKELSVRRI